KVFGDTEQDDVWQDLGDILSRTYRRIDGTVLAVTATGIDMRHKPQKVRQFVRSCGLPRVYPCYGVGGTHPLMVTPRWNKHYRLRTYAVSGKEAKDMLFARLKVDQPGPRYLHFPRGNGYNEEFFSQLTAEVLKTFKVYGFPQQRY